MEELKAKIEEYRQKLSKEDQIWLRNMWHVIRETDRHTTYKDLRVNVADKIPENYYPRFLSDPNSRIYASDTMIKIVGVLCISDNFEVLGLIDLIILRIDIITNYSV